VIEEMKSAYFATTLSYLKESLLSLP